MKITKTGEQITLELGLRQTEDVNLAMVVMAGRSEKVGLGEHKETMLGIAEQFKSRGNNPATVTLSYRDAIIFNESLVAIATSAASESYTRTILIIAAKLDKVLVPPAGKPNNFLSPRV